jgi:4-hydroxy-tetrahydrodipicolinate synthase
MSQMVEIALAGDWEIARKLHYRLLPLMETNFIESSPGPVKAALAMMGIIEENYRLPLVPIQTKSKNEVRKVLIDLGLLKEASYVAS